MMKFIKIFFLLLLPHLTFSQTTIYEAFQLEKMDCKVDDYTEETTTSGAVALDEEYLPASKISEVHPLEDLEKQVVQNFQKPSAFYSPTANPAFSLPLKGGDICFKEKGKWGVKDASGKIILEPQFDFVKTDTAQFGLVGYKKEKCNYYVTKKYVKALQEDYYAVEAMGNGSFIVQTARGFGIMNAQQEWVLSPQQRSIEVMSNEEGGVYDVFDGQRKRFVFVEKNKKRLYPKGIRYKTGFDFPIFHGDFLAYTSVVFNYKTGEQFFCHPDFSTEIVSKQSPLIFVQKEQAASGGYLSGFDGQLVSTQKFHKVQLFNKFNQAIASVRKDNKGKPLFGVIDEKGEWIIAPQFKKIEFKFDHYLVALVDAKDYGFQRIYDTRGEILLTNDMEVDIAREDIFIRKRVVGEEFFCDVIQFPENKILKKDLPGSSVKYYKLCDGYVLAAYHPFQQHFTILDEDFQLLAEQVKNLSYGAEKLTLKLPRVNGKARRQTLSCGNKIKSFEIAGQPITDYGEYIQISEELSFMKNLSGESYFIYKDTSIQLRGEDWEGRAKFSMMQLAHHKDFVILQKRGNFSMSNLEGEMILPNTFSYLGPFDAQTGLASFSMHSNERGYLTREGKFLFGQRYDNVHYLAFDLFKVEVGEYEGIVNRAGKIIVPLQKNFVWLNGGLITIYKNMKPLKSYSIDGRVIE